MLGSVWGGSRAGGAGSPARAARVGAGCDDGRMWELAHRTRAESASTVVRSRAATSAEAIAEVRAVIPEDHLILYMLRLDGDPRSALLPYRARGCLTVGREADHSAQRGQHGHQQADVEQRRDDPSDDPVAVVGPEGGDQEAESDLEGA